MNFQIFLAEYKRLKEVYPIEPDHIFHCENVAGDHIYESKDLYFCFNVFHCHSGAHLYNDSYMLVNCFDCDASISSELLYESVDCAKCYDSSYLENCLDLVNCHYCVDCVDLKNCFGCVRLTHKQYCLFNRQLAKEEYNQKVGEYKKRPASEILKLIEDLRLTQPALYKHEGRNQNSEHGDYIYHDKNCYYCFDSSRSENCAYLFNSHECKSSLDQTYGFQNELCYECIDTAFAYNSTFLEYSGPCRDCHFCFSCSDCEYCFGCFNLSHKKYCLLNRQLTEEEYFKQIKIIKESIN